MKLLFALLTIVTFLAVILEASPIGIKPQKPQLQPQRNVPLQPRKIQYRLTLSTVREEYNGPDPSIYPFKTTFHVPQTITSLIPNSIHPKIVNKKGKPIPITPYMIESLSVYNKKLQRIENMLVRFEFHVKQLKALVDFRRSNTVEDFKMAYNELKKGSSSSSTTQSTTLLEPATTSNQESKDSSENNDINENIIKSLEEQEQAAKKVVPVSYLDIQINDVAAAIWKTQQSLLTLGQDFQDYVQFFLTENKQEELTEPEKVNKKNGKFLLCCFIGSGLSLSDENDYLGNRLGGQLRYLVKFNHLVMIHIGNEFDEWLKNINIAKYKIKAYSSLI